MNVFDNSSSAKDFVVTQSYFYTPEPIKWDSWVDYADKNILTPPTYEWTHRLGDIINALITAELE